MIYDVIWNDGQALFSLFNQIFYLISDAVYKSSIYYFYLLFEVYGGYHFSYNLAPRHWSRKIT